MKANWIDAKTEQPDTIRDVLIVIDGEVWIGCYSNNTGYWFKTSDDGGLGGEVDNVTHWCELPEMPSEGGGA